MKRRIVKKFFKKWVRAMIEHNKLVIKMDNIISDSAKKPR